MAAIKEVTRSEPEVVKTRQVLVGVELGLNLQEANVLHRLIGHHTSGSGEAASALNRIWYQLNTICGPAGRNQPLTAKPREGFGSASYVMEISGE